MSIGGVETVVINNPESRAKVKRLINEAVNCMAMQDGQKEAVKQIIEVMKEEFNIPPKQARSIIKRQYKQDLSIVEAEHDATIDLYNSIYGTTPADDESDD